VNATNIFPNFLLLGLLVGGLVQAQTPEMRKNGTQRTAMTDTLPNFDKLWNFGDPAATEAKFRELLPQAEASGDRSYHVQLLTQIARTYSLRAKFNEAHSLLDTIEELLTPDLNLARVRYLLERGRTYNSSNQQTKALPLFIEASELAESIGEIRFAIDAVHMVAIAERNPKDQIKWNLKGIEMVKAHPDQERWLNALYNNLGDCYIGMGDYTNAIPIYQKLAELQRKLSGEADMYTQKDEARAWRLSGNPDNSLAIIEPIYTKLATDNQTDGWIEEEYAEALHAKGKSADAKPHFVKAYELLSQDTWVLQNDPKKIERLKAMSE
jgi:tetratricopeptide (TPR) repeat protein